MSGFLREGAGGKVFPTGRWNRDLGCQVEVIHDGDAAWFECRCGAQGDVRDYETGQADVDAEQHERMMFERRQKGQRHVRGRFEPS